MMVGVTNDIAYCAVASGGPHIVFTALGSPFRLSGSSFLLNKIKVFNSATSVTLSRSVPVPVLWNLVPGPWGAPDLEPESTHLDLKVLLLEFSGLKIVLVEQKRSFIWVFKAMET